MGIATRYESLEERIIANTVLVPETGCWIWTGASKCNRSGKRYAVLTMRVPGRKHPVPFYVHRLVVELFHGLKLYKGVHVSAHSCPCHETLCVAPDHLRRDTQSGNMQEAHDLGRAYNSRTWRDGSHGHVSVGA